MRTDRDSQRSKVYAAERACGLCEVKQTIPNDQLQGWVDAVLDRRVIRSRWGTQTATVKLTNGYGGARTYGRHKITVSRGGRNEYVMLHEIAHVLTPEDVGHGPEFCGVLLFLVRNVLGKDAHAALLASMRQHRVKRSNAGIPPVRGNVPPPKAVRIREQKREDHDRALRVIETQVARGNVTWRQVAEFAKQQQRIAASQRKRK